VAGTTRQVVEQVFREEFGQAVATLIRLLRDFDLAEEAVQEVWSPSESFLPSCPGLLIAQAASARRSFQPGIQRSGVVAVVDKARMPAMASVAGLRPACGGHPSRSSSGIRLSSRLVSTRPASSRLVSSRLVSAPVRPDASVSSHIRRWHRGPGRCGRATFTTGTVEDPVGGRVVERPGRQPSRPGRGRLCRGRASASRDVGGGCRWRTPGRVG
jgi:hypothetical protein